MRCPEGLRKGKVKLGATVVVAQAVRWGQVVAGMSGVYRSGLAFEELPGFV